MWPVSADLQNGAPPHYTENEGVDSSGFFFLILHIYSDLTDVFIHASVIKFSFQNEILLHCRLYEGGRYFERYSLLHHRYT
jgi:hypothetical protein